MSSIFTRIIDGEIPGRFVWTDDVCVAFLDVRPLNRGHVLVVPREQTDEWTDLDPDSVAHLMRIAHDVGRAQKACLSARRIGLLVAGFEVPHVHIHVIPIDGMHHLDFSQADTDPDPADLDTVAELLRDNL
ncbi:MAG: HIT family protein [Ilumatobacteraceae bacterium]